VNKSKYIQEIDLAHTVLRMRDDGIVQVNFSDKLEIDINEVKEIVEAQKELSKGKKVLVLNIAGKQTSATSAARDFAASQDAVKYTLAEAYIVNNLAQKLVGNFYVNFHKPKAPTKIFTNEADAVNWLKSLSF
jgi:hypothetical protein